MSSQYDSRTHVIDRVRILIAASPTGMTVLDLAAALGVERSTAHRRCWHAKNAGLIQRVSGGPTARWCVEDNRDAAQAYVDKLQRDRETVRERQKAQDRLRRNTLIEASMLTVRQSIVPAHLAQPLPKRGPASVFELRGA